MTEFLTKKEAFNPQIITELGSQILSCPIFNIKPLGGMVSYNYEINHKWILKLPAQGTQINDWIRQAQYAPYLQQKLNYQIPIPKVKPCFIPPKKDIKIMGCIYPKIEGDIIPHRQFHAQSKSQKINFFEQLSDATSQLHQVPPTFLPITFQPKIDQFSQFLFPKSPFKRKVLKKTLETIFEFSGVNVKNHILCHSDLHSENVCMNQNKLQGIIDFDMLSLGDYWMEFSPHTYRKDELNLFRKIYQERSGNFVDPKAVRCMNNIGQTILFLNALGGLHIPIKKDKDFKQFFKEKSKTY